MKDTENLHLKVQELCDCYGNTDPLHEMSKLTLDPDEDEAALKWLALAALHGINANASEVEISRTEDGHVRVTAEYREAELPSPGDALGKKIIAAVRNITHIEGDKGSLPLALGVRDSSITLKVKIKAKEGREKVVLEFPD